MTVLMARHCFIQIVLTCIFLVAPTGLMAAKPSSEFPGVSYEANLTVTDVPDSDNHQLLWLPYSGSFTAFGYDIYYGAEPNTPGQNAGRIATGASEGQWLDIDGKLAARCEPSNYYVVAYSRGRKNYSDPAQGSGINICDSQDTTAPVITLIQPESGQAYQGSAIITGTATDAGGSGLDELTVEILDATGQLTGESPYFPPVSNDEWLTVIPLEQGNYSVRVYASDLDGNISQPVLSDFSVLPPVEDTTSPVITITSPDVGEVFSSTQQLLEGTVDDFGGSGVLSMTVEISGDQSQSSAVLTNGASWSLGTSLPNGSYQININAVDQAGNAALEQSRPFSVLKNIDIGADGYNDIEFCDINSFDTREDRTPDRSPSFQNTFDSNQDIHTQLQQNWKSAYEWRTNTSDVIINNESQFYLDVLGFDSNFKSDWSPFELLTDSNSNNGYLAINAAKASELNGTGPVINGTLLAGQDYLSGVLTTFGIHSLSPANSADGKVVIEVKARMPRGQGVFPAVWLYNESFFRNNPEIDIFEYVG